MVFLTAVNLVRQVTKFGRPGGGPDKFWRVQQILRCSWKFRGRKRNCYRIGYRYVHKALMYGTIGRQQKKKDMSGLWNTRLQAATAELGFNRYDLLEGLARCHIQLDRKVLTDMAIYEPRTFKSLTEIARQQMMADGVETYQKLYYPGGIDYLKRTSS